MEDLRSDIQKDFDNLSEAWHRFVYSVYEAMNLKEIIEWITKKIS